MPKLTPHGCSGNLMQTRIIILITPGSYICLPCDELTVYILLVVISSTIGSPDSVPRCSSVRMYSSVTPPLFIRLRSLTITSVSTLVLDLFVLTESSSSSRSEILASKSSHLLSSSLRYGSITWRPLETYSLLCWRTRLNCGSCLWTSSWRSWEWN